MPVIKMISLVYCRIVDIVDFPEKDNTDGNLPELVLKEVNKKENKSLIKDNKEK